MEKIEYIEIPLHGKHGMGKTAKVDADYDGEYFSQYHWILHKNGYVYRKENQKMVYLHHEVCPTTKDKPWRDHINRDKLDNRSCNLRAVTAHESAQNRSPSIRLSHLTEEERRERNRKYILAYTRRPDIKAKKKAYDRARYLANR